MKVAGVIEEAPGGGGWCFVRLPGDIREELETQSGKKGPVPVMVKIGKTSYSTTTMSMGEGQWFVAVKAAVRKAELLNEGDAVMMLIEPDLVRLSQKDVLPYIGRPAADALAAIGVTRVSQLKEFTEKDLLNIHGIGPKAIRMLREAGIKLKADT